MLTDFGALTSSKKKLWSAYVWSEGRDASFFMGTKGFMGGSTRDATKPIHLVTELTETERGTRCILPLVQDLQGDGVVGDNQLEGNEEALINDDIEIKIDQIRNGVKNRGRLAEQETVIRFRAQAKDKLAYWLGDRTDEMIFLVASGVAFTSNTNNSQRNISSNTSSTLVPPSQLPSLAFAADIAAPTSQRVVYAGTATSLATLTVNETMCWNLLITTQALAKRKRIKPVRINGKDTYVVVMSPEQARDLKQDPDYKTAVAHAGMRGKDNELFTGAFAAVDGLILYEHNKVFNTLGGTSGNSTYGKWGASYTVDGAEALLLGAQAVGFARIGDASWGESDLTDYQNRAGISYGTMIGVVKSKFKARVDSETVQDFSTIAIYTAAAAS